MTSKRFKSSSEHNMRKAFSKMAKEKREDDLKIIHYRS